MLTAEIISVGTELLFGEIVDSNAAFLAQELIKLGIIPRRKTVLGDDLGQLSDGIRAAMQASDLVLVGGGLGPTDDDLSREAIAHALRETPSESPELVAWLENLYASRGREMAQSNRKQSWLIPSAEALANAAGTAPGWFVRAGNKIIVALPGPPSEMRKMWHEQVLPRLPEPTQVLVHTTLHTQGIGESNMAELIQHLSGMPNPSIGTYARKTGVDVRVSAQARDEASAKVVLEPVLAELNTILGRWIWGVDGDTLASSVNKLLAGKKLGIVEAGSGGELCSMLAGQSSFHDAAITENHARLITLGLTPISLKEHGGVVSEKAALELAGGAREHLDADVGLAVVADLKNALAYAAIDTGLKQKVITINWMGCPDQVRERAAISALGLCYRCLKDWLYEH